MIYCGVQVSLSMAVQYQIRYSLDLRSVLRSRLLLLLNSSMGVEAADTALSPLDNDPVAEKTVVDLGGVHICCCATAARRVTSRKWWMRFSRARAASGLLLLTKLLQLSAG